MEHAKRGADALDASDSLAAAAHLTRALIEHPTSPDYFTQRSTAFARLKPARHDLALRDSEYAVLLGQRRQKREKIQAAQQRRVVSLYGLGRYEEARQVLNSMLRWRPKESRKDKMEHDMWMARIVSKLNSQDPNTKSVDTVEEYPNIDLPSENTMIAWLKTQLKSDGTFRFDDEADVAPAAQQAPVLPSTEPASTSPDAQDELDVKAAKAELAAQQKAQPLLTIRHDWYQDNNFVTVTLYAKKVDKTKLQSTFTDDFAEIIFPHPDALDTNFTFTLDPTCASIDESATTVKVLGTKVELKLAKKDKGVKWPALDDKNRPKVDKLPSAWVTKGDQDWDKKAAELTKKAPKKKKGKKTNGEGEDGAGSDSDADSDFGGDAVDGFFKKLYAGADDDTRRAMMKSFQESNGTALSTNWSEVSKGKVDEVRGKGD